MEKGPSWLAGRSELMSHLSVPRVGKSQHHRPGDARALPRPCAPQPDGAGDGPGRPGRGRAEGLGAGEAPQERRQSGYLGCWRLLPAGSPTSRLQGRLPSPRGTRRGRTTREKLTEAETRCLSARGPQQQHAGPRLRPRRLRPAAMASEPPPRLPGSRAQLVAVSTSVLLGRIGLETQNKSP